MFSPSQHGGSTGVAGVSGELEQSAGVENAQHTEGGPMADEHYDYDVGHDDTRSTTDACGVCETENGSTVCAQCRLERTKQECALFHAVERANEAARWILASNWEPGATERQQRAARDEMRAAIRDLVRAARVERRTGEAAWL